jgi:hypothetical protein
VGKHPVLVAVEVYLEVVAAVALVEVVELAAAVLGAVPAVGVGVVRSVAGQVLAAYRAAADPLALQAAAHRPGVVGPVVGHR